MFFILSGQSDVWSLLKNCPADLIRLLGDEARPS